MSEALSRTSPMLVIISGVPGTGKSTLAGLLRQHLGWPVFDRDRFKEAMFDASGIAIDALTQGQSRELGSMAESAMIVAASEVIGAGHSCIVESFFRPEASGSGLGRLVSGSTARQVHCVTPAEVSIARYRTRFERGGRHPVHLDHLEASDRQAEPLPRSALQPVPLAIPLLNVETHRGYAPSLDDIVRFCCGETP
ncbi:MAG TPA: AAA family ATPase [Thermomicrobiales bacterium]|nr:AAA family ATPase [Thermomicrobiales bacterium]